MKKIILWVSVLLIAAPVYAFDLEKKKIDLAVSAGILGSGNIDASWDSDFKPRRTISFSNEPSFLTRAMADYYLIPNLSIGGAMQYAAVTPKNDIIYYDAGWHSINRNDITVLGYGLTLKGRIIASDTVAVKPGITIGGWSSFSQSPEARESGLAINGSLEIQYYFMENLYTFIDAGFFSQPYGGVVDVAYIRGGPIFYFCVGLGI
jgi:hypothetical protein